MILYYSDASPYARVVRILSRYLAIELEEVIVNPFTDDAQLRRCNPLGKIPCLLTDIGALYDSRYICRYLDERLGDGRHHRGLSGNWTLGLLNELVIGLMDAAVALQVEKTRQEEGTASAKWIERHQQSLHAGLAALSGQLEALPVRRSVVAIRLLVLLEYLDFRHPELSWRSAQPALIDWLAGHQDPITQAVAPQ
ncbi:glutathione S-transferase family protein [Ferrimonas pelagia]|uniref:Glutathione S-transferase N-terminal domain-containing protein n=1 Tax=Ferrimonas pelagia TaxID=1177826 RepID=A0ABP9EHV0_9GAMM